MPVIKPIQEFFGKFSDWVGDKFNSVLKLFGIDIKPKEAPKETPQKEQVVVPDILKSKVTDKEKDAQQKAADLLSKPVTLPAEAPPPKPEVQPAAPTPTLLAPKPAPAAPAKVPSKEEKPLEVSGVQATIVKSLNESGVTSPKAHANVLATVKAESNFKVQSENLNYSSPQRIQDVFGKRRIPSVEFAQPLVNNPEGLANEVYKTTDGNSAPGDGFKYRGRGFIQHTGKNQYAAISKFVGVDVLSNPDSLNSPEVAAKAIPWFLLSYKGLKPEDVENMSKVNKAIAFADPTGKKAAAREASSQQIYAAMSSGPTGSQVATASNEVSSGQRQQAKSQTPMIVNAPTTNNTRVVNNQPATMTKDKANPTNMVLARVA
jgi:putative chitinase